MFCIEGKIVDVWADNDGGLWYWNENGCAATVDESKYKPVREKETDDVSIRRKA